MLTLEQIDLLIKNANKFKKNSLSIRSGHQIGACVLTTKGDYFGGCLIQAVISGLGVCAERAAIDHAVVNGQYQFKAIAVVSFSQTYPCGACLQYLMQFAQITDQDIDIIVANSSGEYKQTTLKSLLPKGYFTKTYLRRLRTYQNR